MSKSRHNPTIGFNFKERRDYYVNKSIEKFGDFFDYSLIKELPLKKSPVTIICPVHGKLETTFYNHLSSNKGCFQCGMDNSHKSKRISYVELVEKVKETHPDIKILTRELKDKALKDQKIYIQDKYGILLINGASLLSKSDFTIKAACFPSLYFINKYREREGWKNSIDFSDFTYKGALKYCNIRCRKHGELRIKPNWLLNGQGCGLCWEDRRGEALTSNKEDFVKKAMKRLGTDESIYDKFEYKTAKTKGDIYCKIHKEYFKITPNDHLTGYGCPQCGIENGGYPRTSYVNGAKGRPAIVYLIRCWNKNEEFYKIGKTYKGLKKRFRPNIYSKYFEYKEVFTCSFDAGTAFDTEILLHRKFYSYKYIPFEQFDGYTECYTLDLPVEEIIETLNLS
ncbi:MAG: hypothetical protein CMH22_05640 [Methylophaga sp.]|nr:hypothetical protein [Methylophaga sp.]|tara:strand:+ start:103733 stop:104920 length:1188 start_codon:yes stop_codon:yes gene_type:complete